MGSMLALFDGSPSSLKAVEKARTLLKDDDMLIVLSVIPTAHIEAMEDVDLGDEITPIVKALEDLILQYTNESINANGIVRYGDVLSEIVQVVEENDCELIAIGAEPNTRLAKFQVGDLPALICKKLSIPVLLVR